MACFSIQFFLGVILLESDALLHFQTYLSKGKSLKDGFDRVLIFRKIKEKMKCNNFIEGNIELVKRDGQWRIRELKMENEFQSFL